jgi:NADPH:quinone reductase-like Zn-dependent oxidoreductase
MRAVVVTRYGGAEVLEVRDEPSPAAAPGEVLVAVEAVGVNYRETELARTIPTAYEAVDVRPEIYDVLYPLWPERGPFTDFDRAGVTPQ